MTILRSLTRQYDRLAANGRAPSYGFSHEPISFCIVLAPNGDVVDVGDIRDTSGKAPRPTRCPVPRPVSRSVNIAPNFLWDKTAYALGVTRDSSTKTMRLASRGEHAAFTRLHMDLLGQEDDDGLQAVLAFLRGWMPESYDDLRHAADMLDTNVVFRLDGDLEYVQCRNASLQVWQEHLASQSQAEALCLVTGERGPVQRLHPKIKRVRGAQSSGASVVSFNLDAFESFGHKQGDNAPVSDRAVFAYTTALNAMLAPDSRRSIQIGDTTTVFWADAADGDKTADAAEDFLSFLLDPPSTDDGESAEVRVKLTAVSEGRPWEEIDPDLHEDTRFFVLGLAPNAARLSVRYWCEDSIGALGRRIAEHWRDLRLEPPAWGTAPPVWSLLLETAPQRRADNIPPTLGGALMRAILTGSRYPRSLLAAIVGRMRADKDLNARRVAICRACLARDYRLELADEDVPMSLNREDPNAAYRLGRLFAMYESLQRAALGNVNATIKDRYFGAASATPASVFPLLERSSANHLATLRRGTSARLARWFDSEIDSIVDGLETAFPRSLRLEDQGRFAIGYHHQRAYRPPKREEIGTDNPDQEENSQ